MQLSHYAKAVVGEWKLTLPVVCHNGTIQTVRIEEYVEGFAFFIVKGMGDYTNHQCYKTSQQAINAAAKLA